MNCTYTQSGFIRPCHANSWVYLIILRIKNKQSDTEEQLIVCLYAWTKRMVVSSISAWGNRVSLAKRYISCISSTSMNTAIHNWFSLQFGHISAACNRPQHRPSDRSSWIPEEPTHPFWRAQSPRSCWWCVSAPPPALPCRVSQSHPRQLGDGSLSPTGEHFLPECQPHPNTLIAVSSVG